MRAMASPTASTKPSVPDMATRPSVFRNPRQNRSMNCGLLNQLKSMSGHPVRLWAKAIAPLQPAEHDVGKQRNGQIDHAGRRVQQEIGPRAGRRLLCREKQLLGT